MRKDHFLFIAAFVMDLGTGIAVFTVPLVALELGASVIELGLIGTVGSMAYALACSVTGKLADRYDRRRLMGIASLAGAGIFVFLIFVETLWTLLISAAFAWMTLALFWPALQAELAEGRNRAQLVKTLGTFNMIWTVGFMSGPLLGGPLFEIHPRLPFVAAVIGMAALSAALFLRRFKTQDIQTPQEEDLSESVHTGDNARYRLIAWTASFTAFFMLGVVNNQFPKLATELAISPTILGYLFAAPRLVQFGIFFLVRRTSFWQYRLYPLVIPQLCAIIGMMIVATMDTTVILGMAFATIGLLVGSSFSASQFYAFFQEERKGERGAINEMIVGMGHVFGPLFGGLLAQAAGLRAPYMFCCVVLAAGILIEYRLAYRAQGPEKIDI